ncbi:hypothetical protein V6Z11_D12G045400 [Gossypium hirsutum]
MEFSKVSTLALTCLVGLVLALPSHAQDSKQDYLNAHNRARAAVGVGPMTWDNTVAAYAENYAKQRKADCNLVHSGGRYGENLAWSSADLSGTHAVNMWVCGHYTQVVWRNSVHLGCAKVKCNNGGTFIVCNYSPRGNIVGQKPY